MSDFALVAARQAKQAIECLLDERGWPHDPVLSRTLDHLQLLIEQPDAIIAKSNGQPIDHRELIDERLTAER